MLDGIDRSQVNQPSPLSAAETALITDNLRNASEFVDIADGSYLISRSSIINCVVVFI